VKDNAKVACVAIGGIVILESIALAQGIDGTLYGICIAAVAGLGGFVLSRFGEKHGG
jgi:hypothetical protein